MSQQGFGTLLLQMMVMLAAALLMGHLMRRLRVPVLAGEILAGVLLGPTVLGTLTPTIFDWLFPGTGPYPSGGENIIKLGIVLFLFVVGLEVDLAYLQSRVTVVIRTSIAGIIVPFILGFAAVILLPDWWQADGSGAGLLAVFVGTALSISALPVIARILMELDLLKEKLGMLIMAVATIDDLIGWSLFGIILSNFEAGGKSSNNPWLAFALQLGFSGLMLTIIRWVRRHTTPFLQVRQSLLELPGWIAITTVLVLAVAAVFEYMGTHAFLGAFLLGVTLAHQGEPWRQAHTTIRNFVVGVFVPIYFVSIGLQVNFASNFDVVLVIVVFLIACLGKVGGVSIALRMSQVSTKEALAIGFGLNARGAMGIILTSTALEYGLISQRVFVALVVMCILTSLMSGPFMQLLTATSNQRTQSNTESGETN